MATITVALEGVGDIGIVRRLFAYTGHDVAVIHGLKGKAYLETRPSVALTMQPKALLGSSFEIWITTHHALGL